VAFGFDAARRLVWLDRLVDDDRARAGALCRRHGERLTVPRGWWLDDRRLEVPELFPVPLPPPSTAASVAGTPGAARRERPRRLTLEGFVDPIVPDPVDSDLVPFAGFDDALDGLDGSDASADAAAPDVAASEPALAEPVVVTSQAEAVVEIVAVEVSAAEVAALPRPDLRDLLEPSTPLLARAFSGVARPDRPHRRGHGRPANGSPGPGSVEGKPEPT
jgi:hypothetical protein